MLLSGLETKVILASFNINESYSLLSEGIPFIKAPPTIRDIFLSVVFLIRQASKALSDFIGSISFIYLMTISISEIKSLVPSGFEPIRTTSAQQLIILVEGGNKNNDSAQ